MTEAAHLILKFFEALSSNLNSEYKNFEKLQFFEIKIYFYFFICLFKKKEKKRRVSFY